MIDNKRAAALHEQDTGSNHIPSLEEDRHMADQDSTIPYGFCQCGCGNKTVIPIWSDSASNRVKGCPNKFIHGHNNRGNRQYRVSTGGYYYRKFAPGHPRANQNYVLEHILIAEKALGKSLPEKAVIHHHTPEQLVICQDRAYHNLLHQKNRALIACGHANWRKCYICKQYDGVENLTETQSGFYHKSCAKKKRRERYLASK
jgi:hypothetical protein